MQFPKYSNTACIAQKKDAQSQDNRCKNPFVQNKTPRCDPIDRIGALCAYYAIARITSVLRRICHTVVWVIVPDRIQQARTIARTSGE